MTKLEDVIFVYRGRKGSMPQMSDELIILLEAYREKYPFVHLNHLGTVGDWRHRLRSPESYHNNKPPDAIDIQAIGPYDCIGLEGRMIVAEQFAALGAVCFHAANGKRKHLHVQVPGYYAGKERQGEVNAK